MKKRLDRSVQIGILAALVLVVLAAWWIRSEGRRARQAIQDAARQSKSSSEAAPAEAAAGTGPSGKPDVPKTAAKLVQAKPAAGISQAGKPDLPQDFDLNDHDVFPGLPPPSVPKTQNKESKP